MNHFENGPDHTHTSNYQASPGEGSSASSEHTGELQISSLERHLSKIITRLTFSLGFLGGITLISFGVSSYDFLGKFRLATPMIDELLTPLSFISMGMLLIVFWKTYLLRRQIFAIQRQEEVSLERMGPFLFLSPMGWAGLFFIFLGGRMIWLRLPVLAVIMALIALSLLGAVLFFSPPHPRTHQRSDDEKANRK